MNKRTPPKGPCPKYKPKSILFGKREGEGPHDWSESSSWSALKCTVPYLRDYRGNISRTGWRCSKCGAWYWKDLDEDFSRRQALSLVRSTDWAYQQLMGRDKWGRTLEHYKRNAEFIGHKPRVVKTKESITVYWNREIVARWSSGDMKKDEYYFDVWSGLFFKDKAA